jgi:glycosyltransferase involved in cell wall biosynthesis
MAFSVEFHRRVGTWTHQVDAFIALSDFQKKRMAESGLPLGKVYVKPNFYPGMPPVKPWDEREAYVVFAGRLSAEKGVLSLLKAWAAWGKDAPELRIVGDGELREALERMANGLPVRFLGQLPANEAQTQIAGARLLVLPSECFEGFPMVVREAFAFGTPAAVSNLGPLPSIIQHGKSGLVFEAANRDSLLNVVKEAWLIPGALERFGVGARTEFETKYTEDSNYRTLMSIYERAIETKRESTRI